MNGIAVLPPDVADQIAAGEVVERPHSVVKELVENALDAGALSLEVQIVDGGRASIRVSDDGSGMSNSEALLALQRHATSKIRSAADLTGVRSFGFRGEALPAIASVSHLRLETATDDGMGVSVTSEAGVPRLIGEISRRRGTTVTVESLFHNVPARRKFLRGQRSEWRAIQETMIVASLTRLQARFSVVNDGKSALSLGSASSMRERVAQIWGADFGSSLLEVEDVSGATHVSGLVERPADVGTSTRRVHILVNGRAVRDHGLVRSAEAAYRSTIPPGMRPSLFLSVVVPGSSVDVNVHPAKAEIRFQDRWSVERCVEIAVRRALGTLESGAMFQARGSFFSGRVAGSPSERSDWRGGSSAGVGSSGGEGNAGGMGGAADAGAPLFRGSAPAMALDPQGSVAVEAEGSVEGEADQIDIPHLTQLHRTYMMFEREDGLVLIDQHAAHERVLYERFMAALSGGQQVGQRLLFPLTLHLSAAQADAFEENRELLERLGFEVEGFGGSTLIVRAVPMPHPRFDAERCLRDTIASLSGDRIATAGGKHERLAATVSCKAAIKGGDQLTQLEMRALFEALARTQLPAHDVHGRAVVVHIPWEEVERRFGRR